MMDVFPSQLDSVSIDLFIQRRVGKTSVEKHEETRKPSSDM